MNSLFKGSSSPRVVVCPRRSRPARAALRRMLSSFLAVMCLAPLARSQPDGALAPWARDILNYGIIIDAGSGGSRIHIYQWRPRVFTEAPPPYTQPSMLAHTGSVLKVKPGIAKVPAGQLAAYLAPLITFCMEKLGRERLRWSTFPLYLKATAGMRMLSNAALESQLGAIREVLGNPVQNPFLFRPEFARVISGEEEGVFGWASVNWLEGTLLGQAGAGGTGDVGDQVNRTYGALDLGGASTQITFYRPMQDILANMFKLQIGERRHWNLYTHSFLHFGRDTARSLQQQRVAAGCVAVADFGAES